MKLELNPQTIGIGLISVNLNRDMGTVTIDRLFVLHIPETANNINLFLEWLQQQPEVTPRHTSMTVTQLRNTVTDPDFWEPLLSECIYGDVLR